MCSCCTTVDQSEVSIIESCGKFNRTANAGLHCLVPCRDQVAGTLSLRLQENNVHIETKTRDNVFANSPLRQSNGRPSIGGTQPGFIYVAPPPLSVALCDNCFVNIYLWNGGLFSTKNQKYLMVWIF